MSSFDSWGRFPKVTQKIRPFSWGWEQLAVGPGETVLPQGLARSYGDSCLNDNGTILSTRNLDHFISFDTESGVVRCEGGVSLDSLLSVCVPRGWFIPVSPGTRFVTLGGAVANDVHGKNHHRAGTFGRHVRSFCLLRSNGERLICSPTSEPQLFSATIAGLGLTGLILWVELQLIKIAGPSIKMESIKFSGLDEFFSISSSSDSESEYTVAWLDCLARGESFARGIFMRGNFAPPEEQAPGSAPLKLPLAVPVDAPSFTLNNLSIRAFNFLYYNKQQQKAVSKVVHYEPFFYPLDSVQGWNRIYGKRGFFQFQCVVPKDNNNAAIREVMKTIVDSGKGSFLAVLKEFGDIKSPGMLSFPRPGVTLCLDFPNEGSTTLDLMKRLDEQTSALGGAIYPAKDATMSGADFKKYFPRWEEFSKYIDPAFSSSFWRRVMQ